MTSKKILSCILAAAMAVSTFPVITANADTPTTISSNTGETKSGNLTITLNIPFKDATASDFTFTAPTSLEYSGSNKTATVTSSKTGMGAITVGYYSDENCTTTAVPKNVGTYYVGITLAKGANYNASSSVIHDSSWKFKITKANPNAPAAPTATSDNITKNSIKLTAVTDCEYSIDGTNYQDSPEFTGLTPGMEYTFYQRIKASNNTNQSAASEGAKIRTAPDTYGLNITLRIGESKVASGNAYVGQSDKINISNLIGSGTVGEISITDADSILADNGVTLAANGDLTYSFKNESTKANKTATVRIPVTGSGDQYAIVVTLTMLKTPETTGTDSDTVTWDTPKDTANKNDTLTVKSDSTNNNKPTVSANNDISLKGKGSLTIAETNGGGGNAAVIESVSSGSITVNTNTDVYDAITLTGENSTFKLGNNAEEKLEANETATISYDGKYAKIENTSTKEITFFEANKTASVVIDSLTDALNTTDTDAPTEDDEVKIKAFEVLDTVNKDNLSDTEKRYVPNSSSFQIMTVNAWTTNKNGKTEKLSHIKVKDSSKKIKLRIPLTTIIAKAVLRHINKTTGALEYVKSEVTTDANGKNFIETETDSLSSWIYTPATGLTAKLGTHTNGTLKLNGNDANVTNASSGDEITVEATPSSSYRLSSLSYTGAVSGTVTITGNKFIMPGEDVTVNAVFTKIGGGGSYINYETVKKDHITYQKYAKHMVVDEFDNKVENVEIPSKVDGIPVTGIDAGAFYGCDKVKTIKIPEGVTEIGRIAFWGCKALETIDIPSTVERVDDSILDYCDNLKEVYIRSKNCSIPMYKGTINNGSKNNKSYYNGVIYGYKDSTAEKYANKMGYTFKDIESVVTTTSTTASTTTTTTTTTATSVSSSASTSKVTTTTNVLGTVNDPKIDNSGKITWSKAEGADSYVVAKIVGDKKYYGATVTENTYTLSSVPNEDYKLYVIAIGADGKYTAGKVLDVKVAKPVGKAAAPTVDKDGSVTWKAVRNAVKYKAVKIVNGMYYGGSEVTKTSCKLDSVPANDYQVYIISYGENGALTVGEKTSVKVDDPIGFVNNVKVDNSGKVSWSKATNAAEYRVVKMVGDKKYYGSFTAHTYYYFDSIPNEDYKVYVIAVGEDGRYTTGKVLSVKVKSIGKASAPTVAKDGTVTWKAVENAVKYKVVKKINGSYYGGSEVTETSYKLNNLPVSDYQIYVLSYGENGAVTVGEKTTVKVDKPLGFVNDVKVDKNGKVTWSKAQNATSYCVVKVFNNKKYYSAETKTNSYQFENACYKDYQVYVIAYGANKSYTVGKRTTVEVGDLGVVLDPKVDKNGKVSWNAVRNAVKYKVYKVVNGKKYYGVTEGTSYTFKNVPTTDYKVYVVAFDKDGKYRIGTTKTINK